MAKLTPTSRITPIIYPPVDSTTAIQLNKADGTTNILNIDTTNGRVGIGTTSPGNTLVINSTAGAGDNNQIELQDSGATFGYLYGSANGAYTQLISTRNGLNLGATERVLIDDSAVGSGNSSILGIAVNTDAFVANKSLIVLGNNNGTNGDFRITGGNVGIGTTAPTNLLSLGGNAARIFWMERHTTANTAGNSLTIQSGGATAAATDKAGGNLILAPGLSTGTGNNQILMQISTPGSTGTADNALTTRVTLDSTAIACTVPVRLKGYTVATLPAGTQGDTAFVTDALAPTFLATVVGGGAVVTPVFYNGTNWVGY